MAGREHMVKSGSYCNKHGPPGLTSLQLFFFSAEVGKELEPKADGDKDECEDELKFMEKKDDETVKKTGEETAAAKAELDPMADRAKQRGESSTVQRQRLKM
jgi:hypothetical protein